MKNAGDRNYGFHLKNIETNSELNTYIDFRSGEKRACKESAITYRW